jgi:hypothetical protein
MILWAQGARLSLGSDGVVFSNGPFDAPEIGTSGIYVRDGTKQTTTQMTGLQEAGMQQETLAGLRHSQRELELMG